MGRKIKADTPREGEGLDRRLFLGALGGVSSFAVVAAAGAITPDEAQAASSQPRVIKARYRESDQVKTFYRVNRY